MAKPLREELSSLEDGRWKGGERSLGRLEGVVPVVYAAGMERKARVLIRLVEAGVDALSEVLAAEPPNLQALLVVDEDWEAAPREGELPYPPGLPYFTRAADPPVLVLPGILSPAIRPRTGATYPLAVWHELAHAFLSKREMVREPAWLREILPQALSAAVAKRAGLALKEHLSEVDREPGFTVRSLRGHADADTQMAFQNLLLSLGAAALEEFGEGFLYRIVHALWEETDVVHEERAEELLAGALGPGGREWLLSRPEF